MGWNRDFHQLVCDPLPQSQVASSLPHELSIRPAAVLARLDRKAAMGLCSQLNLFYQRVLGGDKVALQRFKVELNGLLNVS